MRSGWRSSPQARSLPDRWRCLIGRGQFRQTQASALPASPYATTLLPLVAPPILLPTSRAAEQLAKLTLREADRLPDFTIDTGESAWYWEHRGMMGSPQYVERWERKLAWYENQGITRWSADNPDGGLIVTEDDLKGGIDSKKIFDLIGNVFGKSV